MLADNAQACLSSADGAPVGTALQIGWRCARLGCPWTNGRAERFDRTLQDHCAYRQTWTSTEQRTAALDGFLAVDDPVRGHDPLDTDTPCSRRGPWT